MSRCTGLRRSQQTYSRGASLVEVLVALGVFAINLLAWHAALQLVFAFLHRMGVIEAQAADDITFAALCVSAIGPPRLAHRRGACDDRRVVRLAVNRRVGFTLAEVLIAIAMVTAMLGLLAASVAMVRRSTTVSLAVSEAAIARLVLPALVHDVVGVAGRGLKDAGTVCGATLEDNGSRLVVRFVEETVPVEEHIFAARDGVGRPALYVRRPPHPRQPWIEDVTSFGVVSVADGEGAWLRSLTLEIGHAALQRPLHVAVPLLHHPCVEEAP